MASIAQQIRETYASVMQSKLTLLERNVGGGNKTQDFIDLRTQLEMMYAVFEQAPNDAEFTEAFLLYLRELVAVDALVQLRMGRPGDESAASPTKRKRLNDDEADVIMEEEAANVLGSFKKRTRRQ